MMVFFWTRLGKILIWQKFSGRESPTLRKIQTLPFNNSRNLTIKNAKLSGYNFYMNLNIWGDFQICISVPLILGAKFRVDPKLMCWVYWALVVTTLKRRLVLLSLNLYLVGENVINIRLMSSGITLRFFKNNSKNSQLLLM